MRVDEVAKELGVSKSYAYKIVQQLNAELKSLGYLTISGRVNRKFFLEKLCYGEKEKRDAWCQFRRKKKRTHGGSSTATPTGQVSANSPRSAASKQSGRRRHGSGSR